MQCQTGTSRLPSGDDSESAILVESEVPLLEPAVALTVTSMGASAVVTSTRRAIMQRYVRLVAAWCTGMTA